MKLIILATLTTLATTLSFGVGVNAKANDPCETKVKFAAETLATLNDLNPNKDQTTLYRSTTSPNEYSVTTLNSNATRIGNIHVKLGDVGICRIATITDEDAN